MHSKSKQTTIKTREEELNVEANKVVNLLLNEIIEINDEDESLEEVTLEETCDESQSNRYSNKCEACGFVAVVNKRNIVIQSLSKHKKSCLKNKLMLLSVFMQELLNNNSALTRLLLIKHYNPLRFFTFTKRITNLFSFSGCSHALIIILAYFNIR